MNDNYYDREKLYREVWQQPMTIVAKHYGVSDVAIKKVCKKMNVPTPGRDYWQQVQAGAEFKRPPLPKFAAPLIQHFGASADQEKFRKIQAVIKEKAPTEPVLSIVVSERLLRPHPLVADAAAAFKKLWANDREKNPVWHLNGQHLNIRVAKNSADRALLIMDTVLKALTKAGYSFSYDNRSKSTGVLIEGEVILFRLHEHVKQVPHIKTAAEIAEEKKYSWRVAPIYDHMPTGELTLSIDYYPYLPRKNWADGKNHKVEEYLADFIAGLKLAAAHAKIETERKRQEEARRREAAERQRIFAQRRDAELEKFSALEKRAADWQRAQVLRGYIEALAASLPSDSAETAVADQQAYIAWAREKNDWLNPLVAKTDELLGCRHPKG